MIECIKTASWLAWAIVRFVGMVIGLGLYLLMSSFKWPWLEDFHEKWHGWLALAMTLMIGVVLGSVSLTLGILSAGVVLTVIGTASFMSTSRTLG